MIVFPNAKINIGLNIVERRPDGYHNLESVFYPIKIYDRLQVEEATNSLAAECNIVSEGYTIAGDSKDNLVVKAYNLIRQEYKIPAVNVKLTKLIPMGAGLGGGSSDAAYMLKALNDLFELNISEEKLQQIAAKLGADCAIFIKNQPVYATGIGNVFHYDVKIPSLAGKTIIVVKPDVFVSTKDAYSMIHPKSPKYSLTESICKPTETWKDTIVNDFEVSVFAKFPLIGDVKTKLYNLGAEYASMSGSGSSVFGFFNKPIENFEIHFPDMFSVQIPL
jgi:4-diphosphocytidyl-2-C-methyl-D-erythritol kinase